LVVSTKSAIAYQETDTLGTEEPIGIGGGDPKRPTRI
jgi:hypothetical protein